WLQWSHSLPAVETNIVQARALDAAIRFNGATAFRPWKHPLRLALHLRSGASMEPQPSGRGNNIFLGASVPLGKSYNGDTSLPPWKPESTYTSALPTKGFNGATAFRPWKRETASRAATHSRRASMEPQPSGRGNCHLLTRA